MRARYFLLLLAAAVVFGGCHRPEKGPEKVSESGPAWQKAGDLQKENALLKEQAAKLSAQNKELEAQLHTLLGLKPEVRLENLQAVDSINLFRMTGFYAKKGEKPQLIVYLVPLDAQGDPMKAAGSVDVQLWNLSAADPNKALVAKWKLEPAQLKKTWGSTFVGSHFRIALDLPADVSSEADYIVRITFTDYLTGRVFKAEKSISGVKEK